MVDRDNRSPCRNCCDRSDVALVVAATVAEIRPGTGDLTIDYSGNCRTGNELQRQEAFSRQMKSVESVRFLPLGDAEAVKELALTGMVE